MPNDEVRKRIIEMGPLIDISNELSNLTNSIIQTGVEDIFGDIKWMGYKENKILEDPSTEAPPEVKRVCPFCGKPFGEHDFLAEHMGFYHTKESISRYKRDIKRLYEHPEETPERFKWIHHRGEDDLWAASVCPFCAKVIESFRDSDLRKHVRETHGGFMEVFSNVLRGESP